MLINDIADDMLGPAEKRSLASWGLKTLTEVQVLSLQAGLSRGNSLLVCAPTSAGKTLVGEIAILYGLKNNYKCLYLVSHKALADQKYKDFLNRYGSAQSEPMTSVGLSTGDRDEGDISPNILISTYEKALALLLSGQISTDGTLVIADELQIISDPARGSGIETLCTILRKRGLGSGLIA